MDVSDYVGYITREGELFASAAERGDLDVAIAACPGWDMRELVRHLGLIHLWAAGNVAFPEDERLHGFGIRLPQLADQWPELAATWPTDSELVPWYRRTLTNLTRVLTSAPIDVECFTFLPAPSPLTMWARRQASEIAIHRFDAESSRGLTSQFDPRFAADMLDELLCGFASRSRERVHGDTRSLQVHARDVGEHWRLEIGEPGIAATRDRGCADLTITATAADLYLSMWNRTPDAGVQMVGDADVMDLWHTTCRVRWP